MIATHPLFDSVWNTYIKDSIPIVAAIIAALIGGIASGFFVHWLTRSREQEPSVRDPDKEEWRELLSALTKIEMYEADINFRFPGQLERSLLQNSIIPSALPGAERTVVDSAKATQQPAEQ